MRKSLNELHAAQSRQTSKPRNLPLPFGGIDLTSPEGQLPANKARKALNMLPIDGKMQLRQGYTILKDRTAPVSIVGFDLSEDSGVLAVDGDGYVLTWDDDDVMNVVAIAGLSATNQLSAATLGNTLCIVDGVNAGIKHFNGTDLTAAALTGDYAAYVWDGIAAHNNRLYLWQNDSLDFYYLPTDGIQGAIEKFSLSFLGRATGTIRSIASWSTDAGQGTNDLFVAITSTGDVIVYEGTNPGDALNWRINGVYKTSEISGADVWCNVAGDLRIATKQGVVSASEMLRAGELAAAATSTPSLGVVPLFREAGEVSNKARYWQAFVDPKGHGVWFNTPTATGSRQIVFATATAGAFEYNLPAVEFARSRKSLWFTTSTGQICKFYDSWSDGGAYITSEWHSDWIETSGGAMNSVRFTFETENPVWLTTCVLSDFRESDDAIAEVIQDWRIVTLDGIADEELPVNGQGDALQVRLSVENRYFESVQWKNTRTRMTSIARSR